jgi:hypothetical protein
VTLLAFWQVVFAHWAKLKLVKQEPLERLKLCVNQTVELTQQAGLPQRSMALQIDVADSPSAVLR